MYAKEIDKKTNKKKSLRYLDYQSFDGLGKIDELDADRSVARSQHIVKSVDLNSSVESHSCIGAETRSVEGRKRQNEARNKLAQDGGRIRHSCESDNSGSVRRREAVPHSCSIRSLQSAQQSSNPAQSRSLSPSQCR